MAKPQDLHVDSALTNFSVQYQNEAFIWSMLMPMVMVNKMSDVYYKYDKDQRFRIPDDKLGAVSMPNEVGLDVSTEKYSVEGHGLSGYVSKEEEDNADSALAPRLDETELINELLELAQEKRVADIVFSAASYPAANKLQLAGESQWGGDQDSPLDNVLAGLDAAFMRPNTIVFGSDAWRKFRTLPEVLDAVRGTVGNAPRGGLASNADVASLFEVDKVLVGRGKYTAVKEGQAPGAFSRLWGKHVALLYVKQNPSVRSVHFGATFVEQMKQTFTMFDGKRGTKGSTFIKTAWNSDEKVIANDTGYFIQDVVA